jgi:[ribosomal protein S18]-alanine N-acetyltransferase
MLLPVITQHEIRLALPVDANAIARMSRDFIEYGLGWRWTPERIATCMHDPATNVVVVEDGGQIAGFAIMEYRDEDAHLTLLAVNAISRRRGIGTALMVWLETTALTAGIASIYLEARARNGEARAFYKRLGYREIRVDRGFYRGREDGVRISKDLRAAVKGGQAK